jgi:hypothetical protein
MQAAIPHLTCTAMPGNEPCRGGCSGYKTRSTCPPLIVIAVLAAHQTEADSVDSM